MKHGVRMQYAATRCITKSTGPAATWSDLSTVICSSSASNSPTLGSSRGSGATVPSARRRVLLAWVTWAVYRHTQSPIRASPSCRAAGEQLPLGDPVTLTTGDWVMPGVKQVALQGEELVVVLHIRRKVGAGPVTRLIL